MKILRPPRLYFLEFEYIQHSSIMDMTVDLNRSEVREAIKFYLRKEKEIDVKEDNIAFNVTDGSSGSRQGGISSPTLKSATCNNVEHSPS